MPAPQSRSRQSKRLDAGCFQPEISSFRLHLAAEGKAAMTARTYTEAVQWFAAASLRRVAGRNTQPKLTRPEKSPRGKMSYALVSMPPIVAGNC